MLLSSNSAAVVLADGLCDMGVNLEFDDLGPVVGRLDVRDGWKRLVLDAMSPPDELCRVMTEALCALTFGESAAPTAQRPRPRLRSVS